MNQELFQNLKFFLEREKRCSNVEVSVPITEREEGVLQGVVKPKEYGRVDAVGGRFYKDGDYTCVELHCVNYEKAANNLIEGIGRLLWQKFWFSKLQLWADKFKTGQELRRTGVKAYTDGPLGSVLRSAFDVRRSTFDPGGWTFGVGSTFEVLRWGTGAREREIVRRSAEGAGVFVRQRSGEGADPGERYLVQGMIGWVSQPALFYEKKRSYSSWLPIQNHVTVSPSNMPTAR